MTKPTDTRNIIEKVVDAEEKRMSAKAINMQLALEIKEMGCTLKDIRPFLKKKARELGYYQTEEEFQTAVKTQKAWACKINSFSAWAKLRLNKKWEWKQTESQAVQKMDEQDAEQERFDALTPEEQAKDKADKAEDKALKQEIQVAHFIDRNADAFKRLAEKEGIKTPVDTVIATIKAGIEAGRIGK